MMLVLKHHPDQNLGQKTETANKRTITLNAAYEVLGDEDKRAAYDRECARSDQAWNLYRGLPQLPRRIPLPQPGLFQSQI